MIRSQHRRLERMIALVVSLLLSCSSILSQDHGSTTTSSSEPGWIVNYPDDWKSTVGKHHSGTHHLVDSENLSEFEKFIKDQESSLADGAADGENVDVIEHFFWGKTHGISLELGALTGGRSTHSMTYDLEASFGWRRVLVEGNPTLKDGMKKDSPRAFSANSAICKHKSEVHYVSRPDLPTVSGILEFMAPDFLHWFHTPIYNAGVPPGNLSSVDWGRFPSVQKVDCISLTTVLHHAGVTHVNFFVLDTEGAELEVLRSIDFLRVHFDVISVETDPSVRPPGYPAAVTQFLLDNGYRNVAGQQGRNMWFIHSDFEPSKRPGIPDECYNGIRMASKKPLCFK